MYIQAAQGGAQNEQPGKGVARSARRDGRGGRRDCGTGARNRPAGAAERAADAGDEKAIGARRARSTTRSSASRRIATAARFTPTSRRRGVASENTYTMHNPFLALHREGRMPARLRIDFLHQDSPTANPPLPTLSQRLRNSFPFFGDDWIRTGGIGEFTGGGVDGLRAIARAGWRGEDHALNLAGVTNLITDRETVNAEIPIADLRWIISHVPEFPVDLANRMHAMGMGLWCAWRNGCTKPWGCCRLEAAYIS